MPSNTTSSTPKLTRFLIRPRSFHILCLLLIITTILLSILFFNSQFNSNNDQISTVEPSSSKFDIEPIHFGDQGGSDVVIPRNDGSLYSDGAKISNKDASIHLSSSSKNILKNRIKNSKSAFPRENVLSINRKSKIGNSQKCDDLKGFIPDVDSNLVYPTLDFDGDWIHSREFWDRSFEERYEKIRSNNTGFPLKVFVIPHSHTDPGWLKTFEEYFYQQVRNIIDNSIDKLEEFPTMKFQLSEISYLSKWYKYAHPTRREALKKLVKDGRLEIVTGGYVMSDEACVNLYSLIDQLVEGHEWTKRYLDVIPKSSWSIDPFGHGSTFPYILKSSGLNGMVIQRIHYAWKRYFGMNRNGDFNWVQRWDSDQSNQILTHNAPFDIYSIKHSCGPHPYICLSFDFRNLSGEYSENMHLMEPITRDNIKTKAELLLEQYRKTASLFQHNVAMISLGDDFRFDQSIEWNQQFYNYQALFNYINANYQLYKTHVQFGTISQYFQVVNSRSKSFPTFSGDFFVYSDIFSDGRAAYWSGYFSTRPYWKKFYRETENEMRSAEILFSYANALAKQKSKQSYIQLLNHEYEKLIVGRQWLALFAHHDAATGTSKMKTMKDYGIKLLDAKQNAIRIQQLATTSMLFSQLPQAHLSSDYEEASFGELAKKVPLQLSIENPEKKIILFNSLGWKIDHLVKIIVKTALVRVEGPTGKPIVSQLNPVMDISGLNPVISSALYELTFVAELQSLSLTTFTVKLVNGNSDDDFAAIPASIYCRNCSLSSESPFEINSFKVGNIQLTNRKMQLLFDRNTGFLLRIKKLGLTYKEQNALNVKLTFGVYSSIDFRSGAYLLKIDTSNPIMVPFDTIPASIFIVSGVISSEISSVCESVLTSTRIMHTEGKLIDDAIFIQNKIHLGIRRGEMFMRIDSDLDTKKIRGQEEVAVPSFFTDSNGFTMERRYKVSNAPIETNFYPVNTLTYLEDEKKKLRLSLIVDRAHGFSSLEKGRLEGLIERRTIYDDGRGIGEGVTDNKETISNYVLLLENIGQSSLPKKSTNHQPFNWKSENPVYDRSLLPTISSHHLVQILSYPPSLFVVDYENPMNPPIPTTYFILTKELPCDTHLINFRTISEVGSENVESNIPSNKTLMILQKFGYLCESSFHDRRTAYIPHPSSCSTENMFFSHTTFNHLDLKMINETALTGIDQSSYRTINSFDNISSKPFNLKSFILKF